MTNVVHTAGRLGVAVALLTECLGPLEVSAAVIESEDGNEAIETLIDQVRKFCADAAALPSTSAKGDAGEIDWKAEYEGAQEVLTKIRTTMNSSGRWPLGTDLCDAIAAAIAAAPKETP